MKKVSWVGMRRCAALHSASPIRRYATTGIEISPFPQGSVPRTAEYMNRVEELKDEASSLRRYYPRISSMPTDLSSLPDKYKTMVEQEKHQTSDNPPPPTVVYVQGRIEKIMTLSKKLHFIHITDGKSQTQVTVSSSSIPSHVSKEEFRTRHKLLRVGDHIRAGGTLHEIERMPGVIGVRATHLPEIIAPSLHLMPKEVSNKEALARRRHVAMLTDPQLVNAVRIRHIIQRTMRAYFDGYSFTEVNTPILGFGASGASARPFQTTATELANTDLRLRIAPELFLKRMVIGNVGPIYEIGPVFRNEGVDATHNPEFTMCEFYEPNATRKLLVARTRTLLTRIVRALEKAHADGVLKQPPHIPPHLARDGPWTTLEFLPTLQDVIRRRLDRPAFKFPDLATRTREDLRDLVARLAGLHAALTLPLPAQATLPRLLDSLGGHLIEPLCDGPTWITNHPVAMSPLAKSFRCRATGQHVAARAELFVGGVELVNCYEEENSPFDQRAKFVEQRRLRTVVGSDVHWDGVEDVKAGPEEDGEFPIDENYLEALEWGLPPTGGWGCGVDRLVMMFSGQKRIADVLPFGSLRNVVTMGKGHPDAVFETQKKSGVASTADGTKSGSSASE